MIIVQTDSPFIKPKPTLTDRANNHLICSNGCNKPDVKQSVSEQPIVDIADSSRVSDTPKNVALRSTRTLGALAVSSAIVGVTWKGHQGSGLDYLLQLTRQSENKTLALFSTVYSEMSPLSRNPIRELYETIRVNLVSERPGAADDLELVTDKFFRNLFPVAYHHAIHSDMQQDRSTGSGSSSGSGSSKRDFHSDYKNCLVHTYNDLQPFGSVPRELSASLVSSVSAASVLLRVLREGADVLAKLEEIGVTAPLCKKALLRMNYCGSCHLFDHLHAKPCAGLCQNVMRGCLIEYVGLLNKDWSTFTESIVPLISTVRSPQGIETEIKALDGKLSRAIMQAMETGPQLEKQLELEEEKFLKRCAHGVGSLPLLRSAITVARHTATDLMTPCAIAAWRMADYDAAAAAAAATTAGDCSRVPNGTTYTITSSVEEVEAVRLGSKWDFRMHKVGGAAQKCVNPPQHHQQQQQQQHTRLVEQACGVPSLVPSDHLTEGSFEEAPQTLASSSKWSLAPNNEMLQFEMTIFKNKDLFLQLSSTWWNDSRRQLRMGIGTIAISVAPPPPMASASASTLCDDEDYHPADEDCWTGSSLSDYTHQVVTTIWDKYNPEVAYAGDIESPHMRTLVDRLINLNSAATKASSPNTYRGDVDKMQSDMADGSGDSYPSDDEEDGFAASGSGEGRSIGEETIVTPVSGNEISSSKRISSQPCWSLLSIAAILLSVPLLQRNDRFSRH
ncbi:hypothetical protein AND_009642 [Anopheles darlingi]|uniref:Glypican n=1 Tax=Anopheles darlingi TaxID=43151 RepID=W5J5V0_ANODA|nr:hypothetical protein AND_009642 [Anopheles darlingi]